MDRLLQWIGLSIDGSVFVFLRIYLGLVHCLRLSDVYRPSHPSVCHHLFDRVGTCLSRFARLPCYDLGLCSICNLPMQHFDSTVLHKFGCIQNYLIISLWLSCLIVPRSTVIL